MHKKYWPGIMVFLLFICMLGTAHAEMNYELYNSHLSVQMGVPEEPTEIAQGLPGVEPQTESVGNGQGMINPGLPGAELQPGYVGNGQGMVNPGLPGAEPQPGNVGNGQGMVNPGLPGAVPQPVNPGLSPAPEGQPQASGEEVLPPEFLTGGLAEATEWVERTPEENTWPKTFTVTVAGDTTLGSTDTLRQREDSFENVAIANGYAWFFSGLTPLFGSDDLTLVNFEGTLTEETTKKQKKFNFKGPAEYTEILTSGSVEAVNVANNHTLDYGEKGREDTIANLTAAGLIVSGNGQLGIFEKNGVKVGMTGYCFPYKDGKKDISADVRKLREAGCQIVIASFHWGSEYREDFTGEQRNIGRAAIRAGADIVVGHHPHIVQGVEQYQGHYILYSLGNLVFGGNVDPDDRDACAVRLTFTVYPDRTEPPVISIVPLRLTSLAKGTDYRPILAEGEEADRIVNRILKRSYEMDQFVNIPFMP
ncbi:MAG: CapA family protein [Clostridia bacterium]|nr:CapA family protein [Clostridia bacterium]